MTGAIEVTIPGLDPLPLPGPAWLLRALLTLTFFLHLLFMNFVLGGSLLAAVDRLRGRDPARPHHRALSAWLAGLMPVSVAAAVTFGVAPLLFVQALYGRLFFTGSVIMAWFWLAVIPLLIVAYYGTYFLAFRGDRPGRSPLAVSWISAVFFLAIAFLYSNNMTLMLRPDLFAAKYLESGTGLTLNLGDPTLYPRFLHMLLGAVAVAGMAVAPDGLVSLSLRPGETVNFRWNIYAAEIGRYRGTVWLYLRYLPLDGGAESRDALKALDIEIQVVNFLGIGGPAARLMGVIGVIACGLFGFGDLVSGVRWLRKKITGKRRHVTN